MPLLGNTKTYGLTNVLKFLSDSQYSGRLRIYYCNERIDLFLHNGNLRVPISPEWKVVLSLEELEALGYPEGDPPPNLRQKVENALYEIFFWEKANYVFDRDFLPSVLENPDQIYFVDLNTGSLVMEAARRLDDLNRTADLVPRRGKLFVLTEGVTPQNEEEEAILPLLNGARDVSEVVELCDQGLYAVVMLLVRLLEEGKVRPLEKEEYLPNLKSFIEAKDYHSAFYLYRHILREIGHISSSEHQLFQNLTAEALQHFQGKMDGLQAFYYLFDLLESEAEVEVHFRGGQHTYTFWLSKSKLAFKQDENYIEQLVQHLVTRGLVEPQFQEDLKKVQLFEPEHLGWILKEPLTPISVLLSVLVDEFVRLSEEEEVTLTTKELKSEEIPEQGIVSLPLGSQERNTLIRLLKEWDGLRKEIPNEASILVLVRGAREKYVETNYPVIGDFLRPFRRNRKNIQQLREELGQRWGIFGFFTNLMYHYKKEHLRLLETEELKKLIVAEIMIENYPTAIRFIEAGKLQAPDDPFFQEKLEEIRLRSEGDLIAEDDRLVGDLSSFSLAEVLQNLVTNQLTGTLRIFIPGMKEAKKEIYFERGDIFLIREEHEASEATVSTFLDMEALEGLASVAEETNQYSEEYLAELAEIARQEIYELFLWEGATFTFILDALPPQMYHPDDKSLKLSLDASIFLMEAIDRLDLWMEISQVIPTEKVIFEFTSPEGKLQALAMGRNPQIVYMIDGIKNVEDIIRVAQMGKLETCSFLYELYQMGLIRPLSFAEVVLRGQEAYKRKDYDTALKYYECAVRLNPKDERLHKIVAWLRKLRHSTHPEGETASSQE